MESKRVQRNDQTVCKLERNLPQYRKVYSYCYISVELKLRNLSRRLTHLSCTSRNLRRSGDACCVGESSRLQGCLATLP